MEISGHLILLKRVVYVVYPSLVFHKNILINGQCGFSRRSMDRRKEQRAWSQTELSSNPGSATALLGCGQVLHSLSPSFLNNCKASSDSQVLTWANEAASLTV